MFALVALPTAWLVYLALLVREGEDGAAEWYPVGRIVLAAEIIAASLVAAGLVLIAGEMDAFRASVRKTVEVVIQ
ncbi:MAG: DUF2232 domain-containing protein, partial [Calothrix sp. SM1_5_4]|nr:DUF2232 domain-containing protein [Calothrix sp. SM1_5_4]